MQSKSSLNSRIKFVIKVTSSPSHAVAPKLESSLQGADMKEYLIKWHIQNVAAADVGF